MTVLLIAVVVSIYSSVVQGEEGIQSQIKGSGVRMADEISRISP